MLEQVVHLVILVVELQGLKDLVYVLVSPLYFRLRGGEMRIHDRKLGLTDLDGAADGALVATHSEDAGADLGELEIFQDFLRIFLVENDLEEAHLDM